MLRPYSSKEMLDEPLRFITPWPGAGMQARLRHSLQKIYKTLVDSLLPRRKISLFF